MINIKINSECDGLPLDVTIIEPTNEPRGIVQISHGMAEHKERYYNFMNFLADNGYITIIHDHRGHGKSIYKKNDVGNFYTEDINYIVDDLYQISKYAKERYPNLELILFSHSMGTLVSRNYIKKYDNYIDKLILCGPPTKNSRVGFGIFLTKLSKTFNKNKPNKFINKLIFNSYNKNYKLPNEWICSNIQTVKNYNNDDMCGFIFTTNGFINLFQLQKGAYQISNWDIKNKDLPIFIIAGKDDPVIQNENKFNNLIKFLKNVGYSKIESKLYEGKRHELLNEQNSEKIYKDILSFISLK